MSDESLTKYAGGCLCGAVRYAPSAPPLMQGNCHCRDCRRASGGPYAPTLFFALESVNISGEVKYYESIGGSGQPVRRGFCLDCGSQLFGRPSMRPGMIGIRAGTLDDPAEFQPQVDIFASHAPTWDRMLDTTTKFDTSPPAP